MVLFVPFIHLFNLYVWIISNIYKWQLVYVRPNFTCKILIIDKIYFNVCCFCFVYFRQPYWYCLTWCQFSWYTLPSAVSTLSDAKTKGWMSSAALKGKRTCETFLSTVCLILHFKDKWWLWNYHMKSRQIPGCLEKLFSFLFKCCFI